MDLLERGRHQGPVSTGITSILIFDVFWWGVVLYGNYDTLSPDQWPMATKRGRNLLLCICLVSRYYARCAGCAGWAETACAEVRSATAKVWVRRSAYVPGVSRKRGKRNVPSDSPFQEALVDWVLAIIGAYFVALFSHILDMISISCGGGDHVMNWGTHMAKKRK